MIRNIDVDSNLTVSIHSDGTATWNLANARSWVIQSVDERIASVAKRLAELQEAKTALCTSACKCDGENGWFACPAHRKASHAR